MLKANMNWNQGMHFTCQNGDHQYSLDATKENGGDNKGATPKELLLNAMMGCTAMDVVAILKKMRQEVKSFLMEIEAEKTKLPPVHFKTAVLTFKLDGKIEKDKAAKAVETSLSKYCGVNYIVSKTCAISFKLFVNNELVKEAAVKFIEPDHE